MPPTLPRSPSATSISPGGPILAFFWDLASIDEDKRLAASESLLDALQEAQQTHEEKTPGEACVELVYTVRRLVRGLLAARRRVWLQSGSFAAPASTRFGEAVQRANLGCTAALQESPTTAW